MKSVLQLPTPETMKNTIIIFYVQAQPHRDVVIQVSFVRMAQWNSEYMYTVETLTV